MEQLLWFGAAGVLGFALGFVFGRLLALLLERWESTATAAKWAMAVVTFVLGGGTLGGTALFKKMTTYSHSAACYLITLAIGLLWGFARRPRSPYGRDAVINVLKMSDLLSASVPDIEARANLILSGFEPAKTIQKDNRLSQAEWAQKLEQAADLLAERLEGERSEGSDEEQEKA